ncbi:MAG: TlpA family protein disulfide reductase, partial [Actinomycetota bacterium]|nr:TlpA family protein disulfide reductase [Actinomycetota bacterium]
AALQGGEPRARGRGMTATTAPPGAPAGAEPAGPVGSPRRRGVLWTTLAVAVVVAVLVAVLATAGPVSQVNAKSPLIGKPAPEIGGPNLLAYPGAPPAFSLARSPGHWVLVNFAASWCVPCQQEMPQLLTFAARHARTGDAQIVTVAYQQGDQGALAAYFRSRHVTWPVIDDNEAKVSYGVTGIPESYLVDPQGNVVAKLVNGVVADQLDALVAPAGTPAGS